MSTRIRKNTRCVVDLSGEGPVLKVVPLPKSRGVLNLCGDGPVIKPAKSRRQRKVRHFDARSDFKLVRQLKPQDQVVLDRLRDDLQGSIEKVVRIQNRFVDELNKHAVVSNRTKVIAKAIGEVPFYADFQRRIVNDGISQILKFPEEEAKRKYKEAKAKREQEKRDKCTCLACLED